MVSKYGQTVDFLHGSRFSPGDRRQICWSICT